MILGIRQNVSLVVSKKLCYIELEQSKSAYENENEKSSPLPYKDRGLMNLLSFGCEKWHLHRKVTQQE